MSYDSIDGYSSTIRSRGPSSRSTDPFAIWLRHEKCVRPRSGELGEGGSMGFLYGGR
jgi:hypothetical protein